MKKSFLFAFMVLLASMLNAQDRTFDQYRAADTRATHWQPVSYGTSSQNATIIGVVEFEGIEQLSNQLEVGVFYGDVCRGAVMAQYIPNLGRYYVFLTVFGNNGEVDTFKIYDHAKQKELDMTCSQTYTYHDDDMIGSIPDPYVFNFFYNHFEINVSADPIVGGAVSGGGLYNRDATVTLTATANYGYSFVKWTKNDEVVSSTTPYSFMATINTMGDYVAHFAPIPYEITATTNPTTGGTVTGGGTHNYGTNVTLTATPATGYHFVNWTKDGVAVSTNTSYSFVVSGDADYVANFELNSYNITVSANPTAGGTVTGAGTYNHFATCTLIATPSSGYHFVNWKKNGSIVSTDATYQFEVTGGGNYVANFEINSYTIAATANPTAGGTITGAGTYNHFATCTLTATPATGYHFVNWTKGGEAYSTNTTVSFEVTQAESFVANFEINSYEIGATANNAQFGSVSGAGTYNHFATCTLVATPATGYHFVNWTKAGVEVSSSATYQFEVSEAGDYVANFAINTYEITLIANPTAGGTVTGAGTYEHFANCTLTATPATGYHFVNWTKAGVEVSTSATYQFEVSGAGDYAANFEINSYEIAAVANNAQFGSVTGAGTYNHFETCVLVANPATGYHFVNWTSAGVEISTSATYQFEVSGAGDYVANFAINTYEITAVANPTAGGTVTGAGTYEHFATCSLTATPATGYHFVNWTKAGVEVSTSDTYQFEVSGAGEYVANFEINSYEIVATANNALFGSVSGSGTYNHFETCTLVATPSTGYHFVNWTKGGEAYSTNATISYEVTQAESFVANFEINSYEIVATANNALFGSVSGAGTYNHYETCTLIATAATGYHFVNWTSAGVEVSTSATYQFEVSGASDYVANFAINTYEITVVANPTAGGTVTGAGTYEHFATCTLTATPSTGYHFVNWTKGGEAYSTDLIVSFEVTQAESFVANFEINSYEIVATANNAQFGSVSGAGTYNHFETCTLVATPATGYHFVNWTSAGVEVSTSATYQFEVSGAGNYVANFAINTYEITAVANPTAGGTVTGAGTYEHFATCTLTATPAIGYHFVNWTKGGEAYSTDLTVSFEVTQAEEFVANFEINSYEIVATANNAQFGSVSGAGMYNHFETCTLVATPATGYHFVNWTKGEEVYSTSTTVSFEVIQAESFVANFEINSYEIVATANNALYGSVSGAGTYNHFETCTLVATPATGYHFVNWTKAGVEVSSSATYQFEVSGAGNYVANFAINSYAITAVADPAVGGTVTGAGIYDHFVTCTLTATPETGYHFVNWTKGGVEYSTELTISFEVTQEESFVANFEINSYEIGATANNAEFGSVSGAGTYNHFETCTLVATPVTGYHFVNWTKVGAEVSTSATYQFEVSGAGDYVANFAINTYEITVVANPVAGGTVTGAGTYEHFATCTLTATPSTGYHFVNWTKGGEAYSTELIISFEVTQAESFVANFEINSYEIVATANNAQFGSVSGAGTYNHFETCTLVATPATGYHFVNWTKGGEAYSTNTTISFEVTQAESFVANFEINSYEIVATANNALFGSVSGAGTYNHFETCTLVATPATGYHFVNWTKAGEVYSTNTTISFEVTQSESFVANFEINSYEIVATANNTQFGSVSGAGTYNHFETCTLVATPATGYHFVNWTKAGVEVSTNATYQFEVSEAGDYVANFAINTYEITVVANPTAGGTVTGAGTYEHFATCTLTAAPATGYHFVNWTSGGEAYSTEQTISFDVTQAESFVANFAINSYEIVAIANNALFGSVSGSGTYNHFETCTLVATPATGCHFVNWTKAGEVYSTNTTISFEVTQAESFVANFEINEYEITAIINPSDGGTVTGAGTYSYGSTCTLTATAADVYLFVNWTKDGMEVSTEPSITFTVYNNDTYVANFIYNNYEITASASPEYAGTVTGAGVYFHNQSCTLTAVPAMGYHFVNWTSNGIEVSTELFYTFTVLSSAEYVANFAPNIYQVTLFGTPYAAVASLTGAGTYYYGQTCELDAEPNEGYDFVHWKKNDVEIVSTNSSYLFNVTENVAYVAYFALRNYEITATANPIEGGTVTGSGTYGHGSTCTLNAIAAEGYTFVNWTWNGNEVSTNATYTFNVTESNDYVANFSINVYNITAVANPVEGGTVEGTGAFEHGSTCTLTATASEGYNFINWTMGGNVVTDEASFTITVTENANFTANFEEIIINTYEVTVTTNPDGYGTVTGEGTYIEGETCTITATPTSGHIFVYWTENGNIVSEDAVYSFTVTENHNFVANFDHDNVNEISDIQLVMYPNPSIDKVIIESSVLIRKCEVYAINGALVYTLNECSKTFEINVRHYKPGNYVIRLISDSFIQTKSLIKE